MVSLNIPILLPSILKISFALFLKTILETRLINGTNINIVYIIAPGKLPRKILMNVTPSVIARITGIVNNKLLMYE